MRPLFWTPQDDPRWPVWIQGAVSTTYPFCTVWTKITKSVRDRFWGQIRCYLVSVGTYPGRVDSGIPGCHLYCGTQTQYVWLRTLNPPRGVWPCAGGVGTCSEPVRTSEIGVFGDPQNGPPGGHNGTPKLTPFGGHIQTSLPVPDPDVHVEGQRATTVTYVVRFRT